MKRIEIDGYEIIIGLSTETWTLNSTFNGYFIYHLDTQNIKIYYDGTLYDYDDIVKVIVNSALPAGTNIIGKMGIDQTTDGTTNKVQARNATHDNFNANANLQVNNADNAAGNPAFVQVTGSLFEEEPGSAVPTKAVFIGGKYSEVDPVHDDGDLVPLRVNNKGEVFVNLATVLSAALDSIDVAKMSKGPVTIAHNAITATTTSNEIDCTGYNAVLIDVDITGGANNWTFILQGCTVSGNFKNWYEQANTGAMALMSYQTNASSGWIWKGVPDFIKIRAVEDVDGSTVTVRVQPLNV